jgi:hypothetical protein
MRFSPLYKYSGLLDCCAIIFWLYDVSKEYTASVFREEVRSIRKWKTKFARQILR